MKTNVLKSTISLVISAAFIFFIFQSILPVSADLSVQYSLINGSEGEIANVNMNANEDFVILINGKLKTRVPYNLANTFYDISALIPKQSGSKKVSVAVVKRDAVYNGGFKSADYTVLPIELNPRRNIASKKKYF